MGAAAGLDALEFAREQLQKAAAELDGADLDPQLRVLLGLLAAQVALAERLPATGIPGEVIAVTGD